ncbi:MAG: methyltransferase domain-containing protein [Candidatus Thorarchaeota archaeon]
MTNSKQYIKESYAKALEKAKIEKTSCCATNDSLDEEQGSTCCGPKIHLSRLPQIDTPSFGSTKNLAEKANIKKGEIVVDFGSGPGHDLLQAAILTGETGKAIGIDMTKEMIDHTTKLAEKMELANVVLKLGDIENVPLDDNIADVVISNCVINLTNDKKAVFKEAFRILKPGGRLVDSDMIAGVDLPLSLQKDKGAWCGCIAGALTKEGYIDAMTAAGFEDIKVNIESTSNMNWKGEKIPISSGVFTALKPID